ncbi:MAG: phytoene/squalene synthase family protein [Thermoplasmatales archaeon]|nr:MAG: phytoene/squalene synthase family protein [Thermoplasmatales archaeon]
MFYSSLFFPKKIRNDVFICYAFVRRADDLVDKIPQNKEGFYWFKQKYEQAKAGKKSGDIVIDSFVDLEHRRSFDSTWTDSFLESMEMDLTKKTYETLEELLKYVYGAAEVMGLYMTNILGIHKDAYPYARFLGRSMQCINALRDIAEDIMLGRSYIPNDDLKEHGLRNLEYNYIKQHPENFSNLMKTHIKRFCYWLETAEKGYHYMPKRYLISVKTAMDMYQWTAEQLLKNPFIVYEWKVKPLISQIISTVFLNLIDPWSINKRNLQGLYEPSELPQIVRSL